MNHLRREEINRLAEQIRVALELVSLPVDVLAAVSRLRGTVETFHDTEFGVEEAEIQKRGDVFAIRVRQEKSETRKRFSIAHELGHLFLHMGYAIDTAKWASVGEYKDSARYRFGHSEEEYEAHEFAGAFLMPRSEFLSSVHRHAIAQRVSLSNVAKDFEVSDAAARVRGQWLGIFSWER